MELSPQKKARLRKLRKDVQDAEIRLALARLDLVGQDLVDGFASLSTAVKRINATWPEILCDLRPWWIRFTDKLWTACKGIAADAEQVLRESRVRMGGRGSKPDKILTEGRVRKGGVGTKPNTPPPADPKPQKPRICFACRRETKGLVMAAFCESCLETGDMPKPAQPVRRRGKAIPKRRRGDSQRRKDSLG